jgi:hypothetical protein
LATLVITVPYGGLSMPPMVRRRLSLSPEELGWENFRLADPCLLRVASEAAAGAILEGSLGKKEIPPRPLVRYGFSPLVSDPMGFLASPQDRDQHGRPGFIAHAASGRPFAPWGPDELRAIQERSSLPYLREIEDSCLKCLAEGTLVLLLTLRSFPSRPQPKDPDRRYPRPQVSVGGHDGAKTPGGLASFIGRALRALGLWPELGWPLPGAYVPEGLRGHPRLFAAGLSFRRDLYMDETCGRLLPGHGALVRLLRTLFSLLEEELETVLRIRYLRRHPPKPPSMVIKSGNPVGGEGSDG